MGVELLKHLNQLPQATNAALLATDLIPVGKSAGDQGLPVSELDKRYVGQAPGSSGESRVVGGTASITGTGTVVTGLNTCTSVTVSVQGTMDGTTIAAVSATIGNQTGAPAAGSIIIDVWKATSTSDPALIAATTAETINWQATGT